MKLFSQRAALKLFREVVDLRTALEKAEAEIAEYKEYTEELESRGAILHEKVCEYNVELAGLKSEREGLQMTIRSLKMRGDDNV